MANGECVQAVRRLVAERKTLHERNTGREHTILCFGDSNTWGYPPGGGERLPRDIRWPGALQRLLGVVPEHVGPSGPPWTLRAAAEAAGVSVRCARKWVGRYRLEGEQGLRDRSSRPRRVANRTPEERVRLIVGLRRLRFTAAESAGLLGMALST